MKAIIDVEFTIDGETPSVDTIQDAFFKWVGESSIIGSEDVDGTDNWAILINWFGVEIEGP